MGRRTGQDRVLFESETCRAARQFATDSNLSGGAYWFSGIASMSSCGSMSAS
jgi:hypothetical protein